jgi:hypothetical protein
MDSALASLTDRMDESIFRADRYPQYPLFTKMTLEMAAGILAGHRRSLKDDASALISKIKPPIHVEGAIPHEMISGRLIAVNHYSRPGFKAWWIGLAISAIYPGEIHWIMTSTWSYPDRLRSALISPAIGWLIACIAHAYGFTTMPPMPPRAWEVHQRAQSVRAVLRHIQVTKSPVIAFAPEGSDSPGGILAQPPPGVGRFVCQIAEHYFDLLPVGLYEQDGRLILRLGEIMPLPHITGEPEERDARMSETIMIAIAACLPPCLRGRYI